LVSAYWAVRYSASRASEPSGRGHDLAVLAAWTAAGLLAAVRLFRWEPRAAR
jgi:hypothetical protein